LVFRTVHFKSWGFQDKINKLEQTTVSSQVISYLALEKKKKEIYSWKKRKFTLEKRKILFSLNKRKGKYHLFLITKITI
jgi:hypothetical protein